MTSFTTLFRPFWDLFWPLLRPHPESPSNAALDLRERQARKGVIYDAFCAITAKPETGRFRPNPEKSVQKGRKRDVKEVIWDPFGGKAAITARTEETPTPA